MRIPLMRGHRMRSRLLASAILPLGKIALPKADPGLDADLLIAGLLRAGTRHERLHGAAVARRGGRSGGGEHVGLSLVPRLDLLFYYAPLSVFFLEGGVFAPSTGGVRGVAADGFDAHIYQQK